MNIKLKDIIVGRRYKVIISEDSAWFGSKDCANEKNIHEVKEVDFKREKIIFVSPTYFELYPWGIDKMTLIPRKKAKANPKAAIQVDSADEIR